MKRLFSVLALAAVMLLPGTGKLFAQDQVTDDFTAVNATGKTYIWGDDYYTSDKQVGLCDVVVTKMPSGSTPGQLAITHAVPSWYSYYPNSMKLSVYIKDKSGRLFYITKIGNDVFKNETNIYSLYMECFTSDATKEFRKLPFEIGASAFEGCTNLTNINVTANGSKLGATTELYRVGANAFKNCSKLTTNIASRTGGYISANAFENCSALTSLSLSGSIDKTAFTGCTGVKSIYWYGGYTTSLSSYYDSPMFPMRNSVTSIEIYGSVPAHFFETFTELTKVTCPAKIWDNLANTNQYQMGIGDNGFGNCYQLAEVEVAGAIHPKAFYNCSKLAKITWRGAFLAQSQVPTDYDNGFFNSAKNYVTEFIIEDNSNTHPNSYIPSYLCYGMSKLTEITIPDYVSSIGEGAFRECSALKWITFDNKENSQLSVIGSTAFMDCSALTSITLPVSIEYIYDEAFSYCTKMTTCPLNSTLVNLKHLGRALFYNSAIKSLYVPAGVKTIGGALVYGGSNSQCELIIYMPKNLTRDKIGGSWADLFFGTESFNADKRNGVTTVRINAEAKEIPDSLFYNFKGLVAVTDETQSAWLDNVDYVGKAAFKNCEKMWGEGAKTRLDNVSSVGEAAFEGSNFSGHIEFKELQDIGKRAFANTQLVDMSRMGTMPKLITIGEEAFADNKLLEKAFVPDKVKKLSAGAFSNCINLKKLNLGSTEVIGNNAFLMADIDTLRLPDVSAIGNSAFASNTNLKTVIINNKIPTVIADGTTDDSFNGSPVEKILGGCAVIDDLKNDENWKKVCANIQTADMGFKYPKIYDGWWLMGQGVLDTVAELDCTGKFTLEAKPKTEEGYYFVSWGDGNTDNPRTWDMNDPENNQYGYNISVVFDNESLYTEDIKVNVQPAGIANITVYDFNTGLENKRGKYKRDASYIFIPEQFEPDAWYTFSHWDYDMNRMATVYSSEDELYPDGLQLSLHYMPMGGGMMDPENPDPEPYEEPEFPQEITAVYAPQDIFVSIIICSDGRGTFEYTGEQRLGQTLTLTAQPKDGFKFWHWNDDLKATQATDYKLTLTPELLIKQGMMPEDEGTRVYNKETKTYEPYESWSEYAAEICAWFVPIGTDVEDLQEDQPHSIKVLRNGVLYIERNGNLYDATGTQVK